MGIRTWFAVVATIIAYPLQASPAGAEPIRQWRLHDWNIGAYSDNRTGQFSHCAARAEYKSGISLLFAVTRTLEWRMSFASAAWSLRPNSKYQIRYAIDDYRALHSEAVAISDVQVTVDLPSKALLFELFRKGRVLRVEGAGQLLAFNLDYTSAVLNEVLDCAVRYRAASNATAANNQNPFEQSSSVKPGLKGNAAAYRAEAATVAANILSASGIAGFALTPEIPPDLSFIHALWTAPGLVGGVEILETETITSASTIRLALSAQNCKGAFASGKLPATGNVIRIRTMCSADGKNTAEAEYSFLSRPKGGVYVLSLFGAESAGPTSIEQSGARLLEAAIKRFQ